VSAFDAVTARLAAAPKYRAVHPDTIAEVVRYEVGVLGAKASAAAVEQRARARLHKVAALHLLTTRPAALRKAVTEPRQILAGHISTAERLPDLDAFYPTVLSLAPPPATIADLACALNPFTLPWLRAVSPAAYTGYDLNADFVALGNAFLAAYPRCEVRHADVLTTAPERADLALLLKTYHCIEDRARGAALALVDRLAARHVVVSFPTRAMNGRSAVFARRHVTELTELAAQRGWPVSRAALPTEEFVVLDKGIR
jgi:16S rRNA (guanine(1405)-N(7))-methyltransferase